MEVVADTGQIIEWGSWEFRVPTVFEHFQGHQLVDLAAGGSLAFVCVDNGRVMFINDNKDKEQMLLDAVLGDADIVKVATSGTHALFVTKEGIVFSFGPNNNGQLGVHNIANYDAPQCVKHLKDIFIISVACGEQHSCAIAANGDLYTWGRGAEGQLGRGMSEVIIPTPTCVPSFFRMKVKKVDCGPNFTIALVEDENQIASVYSWGEGQSGQLGIGRVTSSAKPKRIAVIDHGVHNDELSLDERLEIEADTEPDGFIDIACGWGHVLACSVSGTVYSWGCNVKGQLGVGDKKTRFWPHRVKPIRPGFAFLDTVVAGGHLSAAVSVSGMLFTWGFNKDGRLGHGGEGKKGFKECFPNPVQVRALCNFPLSRLVCCQDNMFAFSETKLLQLKPTGGLCQGGTPCELQGTSMYHSSDINVRFSMDGVQKIVPGRFNVLTKFVECTAPAFEEPGTATVELALTNDIYTKSTCEFQYYINPNITSVSTPTAPAQGGSNIVLNGDDFEACHQLVWTRKIRIRFRAKEDPSKVVECSGVYRERLLEQEELEARDAAKLKNMNAEQLASMMDDEDDEESHTVGEILVGVPPFDTHGASYMGAIIELSVNGVDFVPLNEIDFGFENVFVKSLKPNCVSMTGGTLEISGSGFKSPVEESEDNQQSPMIKMIHDDAEVIIKATSRNASTLISRVSTADIKKLLPEISQKEQFSETIKGMISLDGGENYFEHEKAQISFTIFKGELNVLKPNVCFTDQECEVQLTAENNDWIFEADTVALNIKGSTLNTVVNPTYDSENKCYKFQLPKIESPVQTIEPTEENPEPEQPEPWFGESLTVGVSFDGKKFLAEPLPLHVLVKPKFSHISHLTVGAESTIELNHKPIENVTKCFVKLSTEEKSEIIEASFEENIVKFTVPEIFEKWEIDENENEIMACFYFSFNEVEWLSAHQEDESATEIVKTKISRK
eukprot:TRINITY_DN170_c5_g1_i1.p1 TRINITY_DN170_c5_g1~~TRINITY_DN170_c5_g1_i1.p1  ORF type:complete len:954 (-),score=327.97 TRINITY_DN170_c5_g1_i1:253-3114(-)